MIAPPSLSHSQAVEELIKIVDQVPQLEIPVTHTFIKNEYWREITMPAGMTGVGHIHRHRHLNIALTGHAIVTWDGQSQEIKAPAIFYSEPGAQKAFQVFEDVRWVTIHENPNGWGPKNIVEIEREIFELPQPMIEAGLPVDEYRMTRRSLPHD
jgi:quercetin dioxygenase-like cupin family protein